MKSEQKFINRDTLLAKIDNFFYTWEGDILALIIFSGGILLLYLWAMGNIVN